MTSGVLTLLAAYLLGSIPTGFLLFRWMSGEDIRRRGSGNIGATNVMRSGGRMAGILTLLVDAAKGALAVLLARAVAPGGGWAAAAAFLAVMGHCYPVFLRFRGGKGIATGCGAYAVLAPIPMLAALGVFVAVSALSRMVSLGSIAAGLALPAAIAWWSGEPALLISATAAVLLAVSRHHENIRRILAGREHRIGGD
ncbi:MAG: glycerol-3-phosphate 1-O-acyltransferase PlsY [Candidatus Polarisedimenticolia bacterium]